MSIEGVFLAESIKIPWKKYYGRTGTYLSVSWLIKVVRILRYHSRSVGCISHTNHIRTHIGNISDTGYVGVKNGNGPGKVGFIPNPGPNPSFKIFRPTYLIRTSEPKIDDHVCPWGFMGLPSVPDVEDDHCI
jgi:hypothetical protein